MYIVTSYKIFNKNLKDVTHGQNLDVFEVFEICNLFFRISEEPSWLAPDSCPKNLLRIKSLFFLKDMYLSVDKEYLFCCSYCRLKKNK
jgi:hypothetical protein